MRDLPGLVISGLVLAASTLACRPRAAEKRAAPARCGFECVSQLVVVTTPDWDATAGRLWRFERRDAGSPWRAVAAGIPVVVGRTGLAVDPGADTLDLVAASVPAPPRKREGDGKSPAGVFPLDTVFGFAPRDSMPRVRLPYVQLTPGTDCVDDTASVHYNTVVDRGAVPRVDWSSAEHMRAIAEYRMGVIVGYNATPPRRGRGSCIFLHIWDGPGSHTAGCTAFDAAELTRVIAWLDPRARPVLVQLTSGLYDRVRGAWKLPALP